MYGESGTRLYPSSSSAPGSSSVPGTSSDPEAVHESQSSQRVPPPAPRSLVPPAPDQHHHAAEMPPPPVPPPMAPPMPHGVHPDLEVPPYCPYSQYTVEDILGMPGREGLPVLDPDRRPGTMWYDVNIFLKDFKKKTF